MNYRIVQIDSDSAHPPAHSVLVIYTGGTLGMSYDQQGTLRPFNFGKIIDEMPVLKSMDIHLTVISFPNPIDSSNMTVGHWNDLAYIIQKNYDSYHGFVVLHGTDTMAYSASALSFMLEGLGKPVIFTGSQLPIGAARTDAGQNLIAALQIASAYNEKGPIVREVCIYFDYFLFRGNRCKKVESVHFDAFESQNHPPLAEAGISIDYNYTALNTIPQLPSFKIHRMKSTSVALIKLFPGISEGVFKHTLQAPGLQGIILETFGSGNAPTFPWFLSAIREAINGGTVIFNVSQCIGGRVIQGRYTTSKHLQELGVISGADITTEAAMAKMQFLFSTEPNSAKLTNALITSLRGEMG